MQKKTHLPKILELNNYPQETEKFQPDNSLSFLVHNGSIQFDCVGNFLHFFKSNKLFNLLMKYYLYFFHGKKSNYQFFSNF